MMIGGEIEMKQTNAIDSHDLHIHTAFYTFFCTFYSVYGKEYNSRKYYGNKKEWC